jgi:hypothetical protein
MLLHGREDLLGRHGRSCSPPPPVGEKYAWPKWDDALEMKRMATEDADLVAAGAPADAERRNLQADSPRRVLGVGHRDRIRVK